MEEIQRKEEIENLSRGYDWYTCYIDSYTQMLEAEAENRAIMKALKELGETEVKSLDGTKTRKIDI